MVTMTARERQILQDVETTRAARRKRRMAANVSEVDHTFSWQTTLERFEKLEDFAAGRGRSVSEMLDLIVDDFLENTEPEPPEPVGDDLKSDPTKELQKDARPAGSTSEDDDANSSQPQKIKVTRQDRMNLEAKIQNLVCQGRFVEAEQTRKILLAADRKTTPKMSEKDIADAISRGFAKGYENRR
jgi:hypothetical protein